MKSERKYVRIKIEDILYLEGLKDYVIIHLAEKKVITRMIVKQMEELLPKGMFMRVSNPILSIKRKLKPSTTMTSPYVEMKLPSVQHITTLL